MNIKEGFGKVTFDTMDDLEQKIDKLTVMMDKLVMEDRINSLSHKYICLIEAEVRWNAIMIREDCRTGLDHTMYTEDGQGMDKTIEGGQNMILIIEVAMAIIWEAYQGKGMEDRIIITEGEILEIKIIIGIGVSHMQDWIGTEGMVEALVTVD